MAQRPERAVAARKWTLPSSPDDLKAMGDAFSAALAKLGLHDLKDPMTEMVARRIIRAAISGERNAINLAEIGAGGRE